MDYNDYTAGEKMNRKDWEFEYTAKQLANAAALKRDHRQSRVEWWEKQKEAVMLEVKESGLEIQESMANSYTSNAGHAPQLGIKVELQKKIRLQASELGWRLWRNNVGAAGWIVDCWASE